MAQPNSKRPPTWLHEKSRSMIAAVSPLELPPENPNDQLAHHFARSLDTAQSISSTGVDEIVNSATAVLSDIDHRNQQGKYQSPLPFLPHNQSSGPSLSTSSRQQHTNSVQGRHHQFQHKHASSRVPTYEQDMDNAAAYTNPKPFNAYTNRTPPSTPQLLSRSPATTPQRSAPASTTPKRASRSRAATPPRNEVVRNGKPKPVAAAAPTFTTVINDELTQKLSQYTRGADRRQALRSLMDLQLLPRMHVMKSVWVEDIAAAEREAAGERASFNGVKFLHVKGTIAHDEITDSSKPVDSRFLQTLREICGHMCDMDGVDADPMALYGGLLLRLSRSISERDALEIVTLWSCGKGELVVLPCKRRHHDRSIPRVAVPIDLELYVESGNVHAKVTMRHEFSLYRRKELETQGLKKELAAWNALVLSQQNPSMQQSSAKKLSRIQYEVLESSKFTNQLKPWIFIDADVVERINFGTGSSVRMLHLSLPEDKNSGYVKKG